MGRLGRTTIALDRTWGTRECYSFDPLELSRYPIGDQVWYSYLRLGRLLERAGMQVTSMTDRETRLDDFSVVALVRPREVLAEADIARYVDYVRRGGSLLLAQNWLHPDLSNANGTDCLAEKLGVRLVGLGSCAGVVPHVNLGYVTNFEIHVLDQIGPHDIGRGVSKVAMHETCGLQSLGEAQVVLDGRDSPGPVAGAVAGRLGRGRFAVVADTELFNDLLLGLFDNERFALNLFQWLAYPVFGDDPVERLVKVLRQHVEGVEKRFSVMTHIGNRPLARNQGGFELDLLENCVLARPRDVLRALSSAELVELERNLVEAPPAPDQDRIGRILRRLGFELPTGCFGGERHKQVLRETLADLSVESEARCLLGCWKFIHLFEQAMREIVEGYGPLLEPDPVRLLTDLRGRSTEPDRLTMGVWKEVCQSLLGRLHTESKGLDMLPDHDWRGLKKKVATVGEKVVQYRNAMAHKPDLLRAAKHLRAHIMSDGHELARQCIEHIPEVVQVRRAAEDRYGRRNYRVITDRGERRHLLSPSPLSPAVTYYHLCRASQTWNLNPVLFQRREPEML